MENDIQQNKENEKVYTAGEVGSLLENINDGIKLIAEGQDFLRKDVEKIKGDIERIDDTLVSIDTKLGVKADKKVIDDHEERITKLEKATAIA